MDFEEVCENVNITPFDISCDDTHLHSVGNTTNRIQEVRIFN